MTSKGSRHDCGLSTTTTARGTPRQLVRCAWRIVTSPSAEFRASRSIIFALRRGALHRWRPSRSPPSSHARHLRARARDRAMVWMVAEASLRQCSRRRLHRAVRRVPLARRKQTANALSSSTEALRAPWRGYPDRHRLGGRRHHREAAARAGFARQIDVQRDRIDALQPLSQRQLSSRKMLDHRGARLVAIALVALDVESRLSPNAP